jgi:glutathione S-transferase
VILVGQFDSPFTRRVAIAMHIYGMPFSRDTRSIFSDAKALGQISPLTRIPALVLEDGEVLIDSAAILDFLDEAAGPAALMPKSGPERRFVLQYTALAAGMMEKTMAAVYERHFHPPAHRNPEWEARCLAQIQGGLAECVRRFRGPFTCGDRMTHADVMLTCTIGYMQDRLPEALADANEVPGLNRLISLAERCETTEAFRTNAVSANETMPQH